MSSPRTAGGSTTSARVIDASPTSARSWSSGRLRSSGMVTALARIEGRPVGVLANNPVHLGGAIDADGADKAARFLQLCDAFDLPVVSLCDTPGLHGRPRGREDRRRPPLQPAVRHRGQPDRAVRDRDPAQGVRPRRPGHGRRYASPRRCATVAWPTGEVGGMGLEGAVQARLPPRAGRHRRRPERSRALDALVAAAYEHGKALNIASPLRDRRRDRPGRLPAVGHPGRARGHRPLPRARTAPTSTPGDRTAVGVLGQVERVAPAPSVTRKESVVPDLRLELSVRQRTRRERGRPRARRQPLISSRGRFGTLRFTITAPSGGAVVKAPRRWRRRSRTWCPSAAAEHHLVPTLALDPEARDRLTHRDSGDPPSRAVRAAPTVPEW